jgi:hypothetical protein
MTRVSAIDSDNDWTFGKGRANYITESEMVRQNVLTRIKSFTDDWFLDTDAHIDWFTINGNRGNEKQILDEVRRVTLSTLGVSIIQNLEVVSIDQRHAIIKLQFTDIYEETFDEVIEV